MLIFSCKNESSIIDYPETKKIPIIDNYYQTSVIDNYRWLEDDKSKETNEWIKSFNKSDVFYDIGANIGFYSLLASKFMRSKTYSFEPDLMNARLLYENIIGKIYFSVYT